MARRSNRREFMQTSAVIGAGYFAAAGLQAAPSKSANEQINFACIGIGGKGESDSNDARSSGNIVAVCDIDESTLEKGKVRFRGAKTYFDFRKMLETEKNIDAVTVSTPDHCHAVAAAMAMRMGKHCFAQKPLTHSIFEARTLGNIAKEKGVATQMGNQGTASSYLRKAAAAIKAGTLGKVTEVHVWTNRPVWPQGLDRPTEKVETPKSIHWNEFLGPAPERPYHPAYHPFKWRGLWDFGTGALGDMGAHIFDQPFWALKLKSPVSVQASSTPFTKDYYPWAEVVTYEFAAREGMGPLTLTWWDGGLMPPRPPELEPGRMMGDEGGGVLFRGDKGLIMCSVYGENPRLIPESRMQEYKRPEKTIPRSPGIREEWIEAIKKGAKSTTDFAYSGPLTEAMLLANVAVRLKDRNMKLLWDGEKMGFTNLPEADEFLHFEYRPGWSL